MRAIEFARAITPAKLPEEHGPRRAALSASFAVARCESDRLTMNQVERQSRHFVWAKYGAKRRVSAQDSTELANYNRQTQNAICEKCGVIAGCAL